MKITLVIGLALVAFMVSGSSLSSSLSSGSAMRAYAITQTLPSCTDPSGQNLPCMMVISTLPPPANSLQCQETSGQLLSCSYGTQNLSNGNQVVVITLYVPANFVFSGPTAVRVVVHDGTRTKIIRETIQTSYSCPPGRHLVDRECLPYPVICPKGEHTVLVNGVFGCTLNNPYPQIPPTPPNCAPGHFDPCVSSLPLGPHTVGFTKGWFDGNTGSGCNNPYSVGSKDYAGYKLGCEQGGAASTPYTNCEHYDTCGDPLFNPTAKNIKCNIGVDCGTPGLNEPLTGPPCTGNDCVSCSKYDQGSHCFPKPNVVPLVEKIPVQPQPQTLTTAIDCKTNPSDPSCTQTLTAPPTTTTKTCPDGSKPDITGKCPVVPQVTPGPNFAQGLTPQPACGNPGNPCQPSTPTPSNPLTTFGPSGPSTNNNNPPPTNNNPTPPSSDNNPSAPSNNGGGSNSGSGGSGTSSGGGGSTPSQSGTLS